MEESVREIRTSTYCPICVFNTIYKRLSLLQKPPDNEAGPPQVYDPRSLYEKLQEQKDSKQAAFDDKYSIRKLLTSSSEPQADLVKAINLGVWMMTK